MADPKYGLTRRQLLQGASIALAGSVLPRSWANSLSGPLLQPLAQFGYGAVTIQSEKHEQQRQNTSEILMNVSEDSLLKPLRQMVGQPAPGEDLGGWYHYDPDWDFRKDEPGFAPGHLYGQWVSAIARNYAITGDPAMRDKVLRINRLYAKTIDPKFYTKNRFPAYCYDKIVLSLTDSHLLANDPDAFAILDHTTDIAAPNLPGKALDRDRQNKWRPCPDDSWTWDESYTMPENLFLAYQRGAGDRYRTMAFQYLDDDTYFAPLARDVDVLGGKHAYSYVNALNSGMQAYMVGGSAMHLRAVQNAFVMLTEQSYATGGWGPNEQLRKRHSDDVYESLETTHHSFETPCGSYAHFKVTRYLLRVTGNSLYGDSMERVMYNTVLGAKKLEADGHAFYYSDYNNKGTRFYHQDRWPCCAGTLPQVAADYHINTYFRGPQSVYVNLYIPSTLKWTEGSSQLTLKQSGNYPLEPQIAFELKASRPVEMTMNFRIPAWAQGAVLRVNGSQAVEAVPGTFATVSREWKDGDRIDLELPLTLRTEAINDRHTDTVALLRGPLVLFAVTESAPAVTRQQLLAARQLSPTEWTIDTANGPVSLMPFTELGDRGYTTYLKTT
jgi:DUF1680 family protein